MSSIREIALAKAIGGGGGGLPIHICTEGEYDESTGIPTISSPDEGTLYLVPASSATTGNLFDEWVYVDSTWEKVGSANLVIPQSDWAQTNTEATDYIKNKPAIKAGTGTRSILEASASTASGNYSHAEGAGTTASGTQSHAEGVGTTASGTQSHAEGMGTTASEQQSHAEGMGTRASGAQSHAEGGGTAASGAQSHAEGGGTTASGVMSHAEGEYTRASGSQQHVFGKYNIDDVSDATPPVALNTYVEIVGNGTANNARSNARTLDWSGNEWLAGNLTVAAGSITIGSTTITEAQLQALLALLN